MYKANPDLEECLVQFVSWPGLLLPGVLAPLPCHFSSMPVTRNICTGIQLAPQSGEGCHLLDFSEGEVLVSFSGEHVNMYGFRCNYNGWLK